MRPCKMELVLSAEACLQHAIKQDFEAVVVFGFKGDEIYTSISRPERALTMIGALEVAKRELWELPSGEDDVDDEDDYGD